MKFETRKLRAAVAAVVVTGVAAGLVMPTAAFAVAAPLPAGVAMPDTELLQVAAVMADPKVKSAQMALMTQKFNPGSTDGKMGPKTRAAVKAFQKAHNMAQTGELDAATLGALGVR